jgi:hypothetical protein
MDEYVLTPNVFPTTVLRSFSLHDAEQAPGSLKLFTAVIFEAGDLTATENSILQQLPKNG